MPPLKYRVLYRDNFNERGAARASDFWNRATIRRILKNEVYLGHTLLGKTKKVSLKSNKKVNVEKDDWAITMNTHQPLITEDIFTRAQINLGKNTKKYDGYENVRKSIFSGVAFCAKCGRALCSCGTVYKGEREKYWYLGCSHKRAGAAKPCSGVRIRYEDLMELIKNDLNLFINMSDDDVKTIVDELIKANLSDAAIIRKKDRIEKIESRISIIDKMIAKLYLDNAEGKISDKRLKITVDDLEVEYSNLNKTLSELIKDEKNIETIEDDVSRFFNLVKRYTNIQTLTRDILLTFVDRIEVGEKVNYEGVSKAIRHGQPFTQEIKIYYKFIKNTLDKPQKTFPLSYDKAISPYNETQLKEIV